MGKGPGKCAICGAGAHENGTQLECIPLSLPNVSDSDAVMAMLVAARCERIAGAPLRRAYNTTLYAGKLDRWVHPRTIEDIAATILGMAGYSRAHTMCQK